MEDKPVQVQAEILEVMNEDEEKAIKEAFNTSVAKKPGNKIIIVCKSRDWNPKQLHIHPKPPA